MTIAEAWTAFVLGCVPLFTSVALGTAILTGVSRLSGKDRLKDRWIFIFAFGLLGGVIGYSSGNSREPVMGTILPALLTFVTALLGYIFGKEALQPFRSLMPYCVASLVIHAFFGLSLGSMARGRFDDFERAYQKRLLLYEKVELEEDKARRLMQIEVQKAKTLKEIGVMQLKGD